MKTLPPGLQAHLNSGATTLCWCWRLRRGDGALLGFTDHDRDLHFDGTAFEAASGFAASEIKDAVGLSVDNLDVSGALRSDTLNEADLAAGLFDDARVEIWRVNWADVAQRVLMRAGSLGEVRRAEGAFTAEVRGLAHYLNQEKGRSFQYGCDADLGDARCRVDLTSALVKGEGAAVAANGAHRFAASGLDAFESGWFSGGLLVWISGANGGRRMEVKRHMKTPAVSLELWHPMASPIAPGDAFAVTAGCDKSFSACKAKFGNGDNFRGFPHMPGNGYVMAHAEGGDPLNQGGAISE